MFVLFPWLREVAPQWDYLILQFYTYLSVTQRSTQQLRCGSNSGWYWASSTPETLKHASWHICTHTSSGVLAVWSQDWAPSWADPILVLEVTQVGPKWYKWHSHSTQHLSKIRGTPHSTIILRLSLASGEVGLAVAKRPTWSAVLTLLIGHSSSNIYSTDMSKHV